MDDETTGQGGAREGAGRPAGDRKTQISVQLPPALLTWLDNMPDSRSEVIEGALVRMRGPISTEAPPDSSAGADGRKVQISVQLPADLLSWIDTQPGSRPAVIEEALVQMYGPVNVAPPPDSVSARMIAFFGGLEGMDFVDKHSWEASEVIDLGSGIHIRADPDYPLGDVLLVSNNAKSWTQVWGGKISARILAQHAELQSTINGTKAHREYEHISKHFTIKTGFGA